MNLDPVKISYTVHKKHNHILIKENVNKLSFIKIKVCLSEDTDNRIQEQTTDWEKIFAIHIRERTHQEYKYS